MGGKGGGRNGVKTAKQKQRKERGGKEKEVLRAHCIGCFVSFQRLSEEDPLFKHYVKIWIETPRLFIIIVAWKRALDVERDSKWTWSPLIDDSSYWHDFNLLRWTLRGYLDMCSSAVVSVGKAWLDTNLYYLSKMENKYFSMDIYFLVFNIR